MAICALFRDAGHRLLLIGQTVETDDDLAQPLAAVGADEHFLVRLEAQPSTLVQRIIAREPEAWSGLAHLIEHTQELAATMPALNGVGLVLEHRGSTPAGGGPAHPRGAPRRAWNSRAGAAVGVV